MTRRTDPNTTRSAVKWMGGALGAVLLFFVLIATWSVPVAGAAEITDENVAEYIGTAKTAADHQALATFFRAKAAEEGQRVKRHEKMLAHYKQGGGKPYIHMIGHCEDIIKTARQLQKDYEMLAAAHEESAKVAAGQK